MRSSISSSSDCSESTLTPSSLVPTASWNGLLNSGAVCTDYKQRRFFTLPNVFNEPQASDILYFFFRTQSVEQ